MNDTSKPIIAQGSDAKLQPIQEKQELVVPPSGLHLTRSIEDRIIQAQDPREAILFTQIRGELKRQDLEERKQLEIIGAQKRQFWAKTGFSALTLLVGAGLVFVGHAMSGFFLMGGGVAMFAPNYVKQYINTFGKGGKDDE